MSRGSTATAITPLYAPSARSGAPRSGWNASCSSPITRGVIVDKIQEAYGKADGIIINPAAYTHTSVAILDALKAVAIPTVEVHISKVSEREDFRQVSFVRLYAVRTIEGMGLEGYGEAIRWLKGYVSDPNKPA